MKNIIDEINEMFEEALKGAVRPHKQIVKKKSKRRKTKLDKFIKKIVNKRSGK